MADIDETFAALQATYDSGRTRPLVWRRAQLDALRRMVRERRDDLAQAVRADLGKPAVEIMLMELDMVASEAGFVRDRLGRWAARRPVPMPLALQPAIGWTVAEPKGVVLIIAPWNYPLLLTLAPLADALAAGNAVCVKPSELAPRTATLLAALLPAYLDPDAVIVVTGGAEETGALLAKPFGHVFYTGGERVGRIVMHAAAEHLTPVTLELGGKSPCFVDGTADLNVASRRIAWGKFTNAGQTCVAPDYVLATPDVAEALAERIAVAVTEFYGERPQDSPDFGRIVNDRHMERLCRLLPGGEDQSDGDAAASRAGDGVEGLRVPFIKAAVALNAVAGMVGRRIGFGTSRFGTSHGAASGDAFRAATHGVHGTHDGGNGMAAYAVDGIKSDAASSGGIIAVPNVMDPAGRIVCGGVVDRAARYIAPTVLFGTRPDAPVMGEEIFGPILPVLVVEDAAAAIWFINARPRPLAAYVFSRDRAVRRMFERGTSSGALGFGLPLGHLMSARLPFGGVGTSGMGAYHGKTGFLTFSHVKSVMVKPSWPDTLHLVYPPFGAWAERVAEVLSRFA